MEPYQQRVIEEKQELDKKLHKLGNFAITDGFKNLPDTDQGLLRAQAKAMEDYTNILRIRIGRFGIKEV